MMNVVSLGITRKNQSLGCRNLFDRCEFNTFYFDAAKKGTAEAERTP